MKNKRKPPNTALMSDSLDARALSLSIVGHILAGQIDRLLTSLYFFKESIQCTFFLYFTDKFFRESLKSSKRT